MMKTILFSLIVLFITLFSGCDPSEKVTELKVFQLNTWHEGSVVPDGFNGIAGIIKQVDADVVMLCEIRNYNKRNFVESLIDTLAADGFNYHATSTGQSVAILSKYEIVSQQPCCDGDNGSFVKAVLKVGSHNVAVYSAHLDYTHYECYMPRGYSGTSWQKLDKPADDAGYVLEMNRLSQRDEAIETFIADAGQEIEKGALVIMGGDFNEPSHLDWQADTRTLRDHNNLVINWDCSVMLHEAGMKDAFREMYPDAVTHPGFTFPSANGNVPVNKLAWAPDADERDRIDFVYYYPDASIKLIDSHIVGPSESIVRGEVHENDSDDVFILPEGIWPTDHKGNIVRFRVQN